MAIDRELRASYPHPHHVCWAVAERSSVIGRIRRWLVWRPWRPAYFELKPWVMPRFTRLATGEQQRCLGVGYTACARYPRSPSLMRRLRGAAPGRLAARR